MAFDQLHYTSCKDGLSGYSGFQFCAATPGVPDVVLREVERQTVYEPPIALQDAVSSPAAGFPVNLLYTYGNDSEVAILARVQFTGLDFSNRSGNYFAHSLVTTRPDEDLRSVLPVELWDAPFWRKTQGGPKELPPRSVLPLAGSITRQLVAGFAASQGASSEQVAALLTAVEAAMNAGRQVLVIGPDSENVCRWIATASYLLDPDRARRLTFSTYTYDPHRCRTHLVGTISAEVTQRSDIKTGFQVFNLARNEIPDLPPDPAALLLARLGIAAAPELWAMAGSLCGSSGPTLSDAFPALASAALILGHRLTAGEVAGAIGWIHAHGDRVGHSQTAAAASGALAQPLGRLSAELMEQLVEIARRADDSRPDGKGVHARLVERALIDNALAELDHGGSPGEGIPLRTLDARNAAAHACSQRLPRCDAGSAIALLAWADRVGCTPDGDALYRTGRDVIAQSLLTEREPAGLADAAATWPELRDGIIEWLAQLPTARRREVISSRAARIFQRQDFAEHPALGEDWLIGLAIAGSISRVAALSRIMELRRDNDLVSAADEGLITRLWPHGRWKPAEAVELLRLLPAAELADEAVTSRLGTLIREIPSRDTYQSWAELVSRVARLPATTLPAKHIELAAELSRLIELDDYASRQRPPDEFVTEMLSCYVTGTDDARKLLNWRLPSLLVRHSRLGSILGGLPAELFRSLCAFARDALADDQLSPREIANLCVAMQMIEPKRPQYAEDLDKKVLRPELSTWPREHIATLVIEADSIARNAGRYLELWYESIRRRRFRLFRFRRQTPS
ncbi:MAG TPA: GTPase-associated protein 1-related protein [Streptosporangiaceae bacterium]